ncbi:hypothetical protein [Cellulomonas sp. URHE0023]|uniref:hypothetical protein n=1 Tax=Cellulomonas sp. URHE0023 TaxID=1380354 RepID=UPI0004809BF8|nr:hypothetical protein [Cellulomonas sp. URHE0023]
MSQRLLLEGTDLAELMAHVQAEFGPGARVVRAERIRTGGVGGFFARERFELTVDVPEEPQGRPRALRNPPRPKPVPAAPEADGIDALLAAADAYDALPDGSTPETVESLDVMDDTDEVVPEPPDPHPTVSTGGAAFAGILEQVRAMAGTPAPADIEVPAPPVEDPLRASLRGIGIPEHMLDSSTPLTLPAVLARVPAAPALPRAAGSVVVVVGEQSDVDAVAMILTERLRLEPSATCAAGARTGGRARTGRVGVAKAANAAELATWLERVASSSQIGVVALAVGPEPTDRADAAALLRTCGAAQVWAVVDARTKTADATRWMADVGGPGGIDAIAVRGLFDTTQPGTVLDLGVPVVWVDGIPATTVAWAAALGQALGTAAR